MKDAKSADALMENTLSHHNRWSEKLGTCDFPISFPFPFIKNYHFWNFLKFRIL
jgi:hypothetical protein